MDDVLAKIQKLLALTGSPNEHEAKLALVKAQSLMVEHNISLDQVESFSAEDGGFIEEGVFYNKTQTLPYEVEWVMSVVQNYFFVKVIRQSSFSDEFTKVRRKRNINVLFFGAPENIAIAKHVFYYLCRIYRELWLDYKEINEAQRSAAKSFYAGLSAGFSQKLKEERKAHDPSTKNALVLIYKKLDDALADFYDNLNLKQMKMNAGKDNDAYEEGCEQGKKINLHSPIPQEKREERLLTG